MNVGYYASQLEATAPVIAALVRDIQETQARWKPSPEDWSILEVINHLYDEEREDFRRRIDLTLHHPLDPIPPNDPEAWVTERSYNTRNLQHSLEQFLAERAQSLEWLRGLRDDADWERFCNNAYLYNLRVGDLLASWAAHDLLHIRQLNELRWHYLVKQAAPFSVDYAGDW